MRIKRIYALPVSNEIYKVEVIKVLNFNNSGKSALVIQQPEFIKVATMLQQGRTIQIGRKVIKSAEPRKHYRWEFVDYNKDQISRLLKAQSSISYIQYLNNGEKRTTPISAHSNLVTKESIEAYNNAVNLRCSEYFTKLKSFDVMEKHYLELMKWCIVLGIVGVSPCQRTYYNAMAQFKFHQKLPKNSSITLEQIQYVKDNAERFGLEIPVLKFAIQSRWTEHGYTEELNHVMFYSTNSYSNPNKDNYSQDPDFKINNRFRFNPDNFAENFMIVECEATSSQYKEVYDQLIWLESQGDEYIGLDYIRCPHCGNVSSRHFNKVNDTIYCEFCDNEIDKDIEITNNNHLLYGTDIDTEYSSLDDIQTYLEQSED